MADTIRYERNEDFTMVQNTFMREVSAGRLSLLTLGLVTYIISRPPDWNHSIAGYMAACHIGRDRVKHCLAELEEAGYLTRRQTREGGQFRKTEYVIHAVSSKPLEEFPGNEPPPLTEKPSTVEPSAVFQQGPKIINTQDKNNITPYSPPQGATVPKYKPEWFERFWSKYPRHTARAKAVRAWDKLKPALELCRVMSAALDAQIKSAQWQDKTKIPHPSTWLNEQRWTDDLPPAGAPPDDGTTEQRGLAVW